MLSKAKTLKNINNQQKRGFVDPVLLMLSGVGVVTLIPIVFICNERSHTKQLDNFIKNIEITKKLEIYEKKLNKQQIPQPNNVSNKQLLHYSYKFYSTTKDNVKFYICGEFTFDYLHNNLQYFSNPKFNNIMKNEIDEVTSSLTFQEICNNKDNYAKILINIIKHKLSLVSFGVSIKNFNIFEINKTNETNKIGTIEKITHQQNNEPTNSYLNNNTFDKPLKTYTFELNEITKGKIGYSLPCAISFELEGHIKDYKTTIGNCIETSLSLVTKQINTEEINNDLQIYAKLLLMGIQCNLSDYKTKIFCIDLYGKEHIRIYANNQLQNSNNE